MKKLIAGILLIACTLTTMAGTGPLFSVSGTPQSVTISSTVKNHYYPNASINLKTPGFSIASGCSLSNSGLWSHLCL